MYAYLMNYFDLPILHAINGWCGNNWIVDRIISHVSLDFKWAVPLTVFWVLWFLPARDIEARRRTLIVILIAVLLSLVINRLISVIMPFRARPMETAGIGYRPPL